MDSPIANTSFIPKKPIETSMEVVQSSSRQSGGLISFLSFIIMTVTLGTYGGLYLYQKQLINQKNNLDTQLISYRNSIGTDFVSDMKRLTTRIRGVQSLINTHIVVNPIFKALEASTLQSVAYTEFSYIYKDADITTKLPASVVVTLKGETTSYAKIALQSDAFANNTIIHNPIFSDLILDDKTNKVKFTLTFSVDVKDLSYDTFIKSLNKTNTAISDQTNQTPINVTPPKP